VSLPVQFLDQVRERTTLSALIGRTLKLDKRGTEFKACCPFHGEKTPSFTVNDAKGFYHCFGCGAHGDAFRWLTDQGGLDFMDAVRELASAAGMELPAQSPAAVSRAAEVETVRGALDAAQAIYTRQLDQAGAVLEYLAARGIGPAAVQAFGIGYARGGDGSLNGSGIGTKLGLAAGLLRTSETGVNEMFWDRITVPIHDPRGRLIGFGARVWPGRKGSAANPPPKFLNSPDGPLFDKGRCLFNLHRAAAAARPSAANRLLVVEGYFDVVALGQAGIAEAVAPMGTALTDSQLERLWRFHHCPVLLFDGDGAGIAAAARAARGALVHCGPGRELKVAMLPAGTDPDDLVRSGGAAAIDALCLEARPLYRFLFDVTAREYGGASPEAAATVWAQLASLAQTIADEELRGQYLGMWRARWERELSAVPSVGGGGGESTAAAQPLHAVIYAEPHADPVTGKIVRYAFPDSETDSEARLIQLIKAMLRKRTERRELSADLKDLMAMAKLAGFSGPAITAALIDIESDLEHGSGVREDAEAHRVLYRRVLGIRGPMSEAMMPQLIDARPRQIATAGARRRATVSAMIDGAGIDGAGIDGAGIEPAATEAAVSA
jgi:DNA primase